MEKRMEYNEQNIEQIYRNLESAIEQNAPIEYEIRMGTFYFVQRTSDLGFFNQYRAEMDLVKEPITYILYKGKSKHSDKFVLFKPSEVSLFGFTTEDERLNQRIEDFEREQTVVDLRSKLKKSKAKNKKLRRVVHTQDSLISELQTKQSFDFKELVPLLQQISPMINGNTSTNGTLGGVPLTTILDELQKIEKEHGKERVTEGVLILLEILPNEELLNKVKHTISKHGKGAE